MAAQHFRFKKDTLYWTPDGGAAVQILGVQSIRYGEGGEVTDLVSDASELVQEIPLGKIKGRLSITSLAQGVLGEVALGAGAIEFTIEQVKNGRGSVDGEDLAVAFPVCVLKDRDLGADSGAGASGTLMIDAVGDDDGNIFTVSAA
jgi:hypothetical protein